MVQTPLERSAAPANLNEPNDTGSPARPATHRRVIGLAVAGAVGGFLFGFDSSVVNGAVDALQAGFALSHALYAAFAAGSFVFVMARVPEANGMSLEQAETLFVPKNSARAR